MLPLRFSIRTLLLVVALAAACLTLHRLCEHRYYRNYSTYSLFVRLGTQIHNGDTVQQVARQLGKAVNNGQNGPKHWQWPILPGDEMWKFQYSSREGVNLQFRGGRLVNFQPSEFSDADKLASMNRAAVPPQWLRFGVWPYCALLFVIGVGVLVLMDWYGRRHPARSSGDVPIIDTVSS